MSPENFARALAAFTRRRPFLPFGIQFVTGETLRVAHPEAARFYGQVLMFTDPQDLVQLFDASSVCRLLELPATPPSPAE